MKSIYSAAAVLNLILIFNSCSYNV